MLFFSCKNIIGHLHFRTLLFVCGFENISVDETWYSLKEQKKIRLLVVTHFLDGVSGLAAGFGKCLYCDRSYC